MRSLAGAACLIALLTVGCGPGSDVGYVELKVFPVSTPLYFNTEKLDPLKDGRAVLRQKVGKTKLQVDRGGGQLVSLCEFDVRKNRIVTVTVSALQRVPRCDVQK
jgi:hypothetical protein